MKAIVFLILMSSALLLQSCKYPEPATIEQKDARPAIGISGAPVGAVLVVDGLNMGPASRDKAINLLFVESGKHVIELKDVNGRVLLSEEVFLSSSTTKIIKYNP